MTVELVANSTNPKSKLKSFNDRFWNLAHVSNRITIAVGYIDVASVAELNDYVSASEDITLNLLVGMQYFDGLTTPQLSALNSLESQLRKSQQGGVFLSDRIRYHGKIYLFTDYLSETTAYVGSGNLSSISKSHSSTFEAGAMFTDTDKQITNYVENQLFPLSSNIRDLDIEPQNQNLKSPLEDQDYAVKVSENSPQELSDGLIPKYRFEIPLKAEQKLSSINACFGSPRENKSTGRKLVRPWYEVELIPGKAITTLPGYPQNQKKFTVFTDNGFTFECMVQGQEGNKNLRSTGSLSVLGAYIKGKLEAFGVITPGERVTPEMLADYGRDTVSLMYFDQTDRWVLDFRVED